MTVDLSLVLWKNKLNGTFVYDLLKELLSVYKISVPGPPIYMTNFNRKNDNYLVCEYLFIQFIFAVVCDFSN